jgi:hypothetical protein
MKECIRSRDSNDQLVDLQSTGIRGTVHASVTLSFAPSRLDVVKSQSSNLDAFSAGDIQILASGLKAICQGRLGVPERKIERTCE